MLRLLRRGATRRCRTRGASKEITCMLLVACCSLNTTSQQATSNEQPNMTEKLPESTLRLGLPSGSMQQSTIDLFGRAGYKITTPDRSVFPRVDDDKISAVLFRSQEISRYVT